ncbi:Wzz/FepE/Etk N-terminal domain-containing protein [Dactylosporangium sp. AC04546]|uniref:Wzz/FepE/Etk N-terminal domain-containing protein n=1 Tax=Dactylosporangium sp. AC04546 TaxID=2862460 RepID=UPI001EE115AA|nr:Wzz/FepE/Etk N-terminal domain-containing protein [Dactylosporangium sp. AC04546]WVK83104.1 Wzz/FepE/Etk N-terminal domain-containing protein [Dactylosporangium sp. AC04546]
MDANRPYSAETDSPGVDLLGMARRHWWLVVIVVIAGLAAAAQFTSVQATVYESATSVLVSPIGNGQDANSTSGRTKGDINLDNEAQLVTSTTVATDAAALMRSTAAPDTLAGSVRVEVPPNTTFLVITFSAPDARTAQAGSHAFAEAYLRNREESAKADVAGRIAILNDKINQLNASLTQINNKLAALRAGDPNRPNLESQRTTVTSQINTLAGQLNQLLTTTVSAGKITRDADLPGRPVKPNRLLNLASGAMIGLLLGVGAAMLRERLDQRVRRPGDLPRRVDVTVLAAVPGRVKPRLDDVFAPFGTGGRIFNRLRNEVLASVPAPAGGDARVVLAGQVVVVAGASRGAASTVVAANLAAAFARTGAETVLVCAHLPDSLVDTASVHRMLGVRAVPGLSDVLAGRFSLSSATQRAPRHPNLSVVTTGGTASAGGLLQSQALRDTLATLRERAAYVVVEAPSTATSADAQSLASLADAAIVAVELRRTRHTEVADAADQLRRVGTPLLGAVVLPRLSAPRGGDEREVTEPETPSVAEDMTTVLEKLPAKKEEPAPKRIRTVPTPPKRQTQTITVTRVATDAPSENGADKRR